MRDMFDIVFETLMLILLIFSSMEVTLVPNSDHMNKV